MLRNSPPPGLAAFDFPDGVKVNGKREVTTPPTQALFFLNNPFVVQQAHGFAKRLLEIAEDHKRVVAAYHRALQRDPTSSEIERALAHVHSIASELSKGAELRAWASLCQALLASNEFRYID